jgi:hypothetical protein
MSRPKSVRRRHRRHIKRGLWIAAILIAVIGSVLIAFSMANRSGGDSSADVEAAP